MTKAQGNRRWSAALALGLALVAVMTSSAQAPTYSVVHTFIGAGGALPNAGLVSDREGNLYGTAASGGIASASCAPSGCGVVFRLEPGGHETALYSFTGAPDGANPYTGLVRDADGNLYGMTTFGGILGGSCQSPGCGVVFKLDPAGKETILYKFTGETGSSPSPGDGLVRDAAGNLYGTTALGGGSGGACPPYGCGVVFRVDPTGNETVLHSFSGTDGASPTGGLIQDSAGNLYGTTQGGGNGFGVVFKLDSAGDETVLHSFTGGADGAVPAAGLLRDATGRLYGTTYGGGMTGGPCFYLYGCGVVFTLDTAGSETVLYSFKGGTHGENPYAGLVRDATGNLYGTAQYGGSSACPGGCGAVFRISPQGTETTLHDFSGAGGGNPRGRLLRRGDYLLGTTEAGTGSASGGVAYKLGLR